MATLPNSTLNFFQSFVHPLNAGYAFRSILILLQYEDGDEVCYPRNICGHVMHSECLIDWLMRNAECPICRATILKSSQVETADEENQ